MGSMCVFCDTPADAFTAKMKHVIKIWGIFIYFFFQTLLWSRADISKNLIHRHALMVVFSCYAEFKFTTLHFSLNWLCLFVFKLLIYIFLGCFLTSH